MCTEKEHEKCLLDFGENLEWNCAQCPDKRRPESISEWTLHILDLRRLQLGGYPFEKNDLDYEEWCDLGTVADCIARINQQQTIIPVFPGMKPKR
ncbi:MAG TPA: hypothetical protein PKM59_01990 [Thermodesulfobacteriota bacterium]|nr:hypothetical protein [Thermodesulfobacteriota bacterium]HNU70584.1 hypothetical protein [Thermodesulfobacteriota bacterium]